MYASFAQTADRTIANSAAEATLLGTGVGTLTFPANFWVVGRTIRFEMHGNIASTGTPTARVRLKMGATTLLDSTAITMTALAGTEEWDLVGLITCRSIGASGSLRANCFFTYETGSGSTPVDRLFIAGTTTTFNTTVSGAIDITFQWGTASALNTITSRLTAIEILN